MRVLTKPSGNPSRREFGAAMGALPAAGLLAPGPGSFQLPPVTPTGLRIGNGIPAEASYEQMRTQAR